MLNKELEKPIETLNKEMEFIDVDVFINLIKTGKSVDSYLKERLK